MFQMGYEDLLSEQMRRKEQLEWRDEKISSLGKKYLFTQVLLWLQRRDLGHENFVFQKNIDFSQIERPSYRADSLDSSIKATPIK